MTNTKKPPTEKEISDFMNHVTKPLSNEEIQDLFSTTLYGSLPKETMYRVFSTLAEIQKLRDQNNMYKNMMEELEDVEEPDIEMKRIITWYKNRIGL